MSSFDRRTVLVSLVALAGCGFTPAYGPNGAAQVLRGTVEVQQPSDREENSYSRALTDALGPSQSPRYRLTYEITTDEDSIGLTRAQEINRYHVTGTASYALVEIESGATVASGEVSTFTAYAATAKTGSTVASLAATRDAYARLMQQLADRTVNDLIIAVSAAR
ncbi:hypothetical protein [Celeribacter sp.]|uniref:hypothetical protein n=1 Tax=Celeribacter sp. TaxID=1890673 RepID=UPI003A94D80D